MLPVLQPLRCHRFECCRGTLGVLGRARCSISHYSIVPICIGYGCSHNILQPHKVHQYSASTSLDSTATCQQRNPSDQCSAQSLTEVNKTEQDFRRHALAPYNSQHNKRIKPLLFDWGLNHLDQRRRKAAHVFLLCDGMLKQASASCQQCSHA